LSGIFFRSQRVTMRSDPNANRKNEERGNEEKDYAPGHLIADVSRNVLQAA
jgi:hypothetical protein